MNVTGDFMWKCETCIHKDKLGIETEICERHCKDCFNRIGKYNFDYQEEVKKPICCGDCVYYGKYFNDNICNVRHYNYDDNNTYVLPIRKNYITRNVPKWCKLKIV